MRLLLDTNRYDDLNRGVPKVVNRVAKATEVWLSFVVVGELRAGFLKGSQTKRNERFLAQFLSKPSVAVLLPSEETTEYYARVALALAKQGDKIPTNDLWIAAQAIQHNLTLDTRDTHFKKVRGLRIAKD